MELFVNDLFEKRDDDCKVVDCERILWMNREKDLVVTISIIDEKGLPKFKSVEAMELEIKQGSLLKREYDPYSTFMVPDDKLSEKEIQVRDNAWEVIKGLVELEPNIYNPSERYQMIKRVCHETGKGKNLIYKYLHYYWTGGKMVNALLPRFRKCGGPGARKNPTRKMGRSRETKKTLKPEMEGVLISEGTRKIFDKAIRDVYLKVNRRDSVKFTYIQMLKNYFGIRTEMRGKVEIPIIPPEYKVPSMRQLRYYISTQYPRRKRLVSREGEVTFNRDFRPLLGSETRRATGPGQIFEIDATVADVYLVSSDDPNLIIGRPVVYIVVDVWSHMIVGFYVGLEGPSWQGVMMAIENTAADKVEFCAQYDITIQPEEWPCCHLPESFYADRGEMESKHADSLGKALGIKLKNAPPFRADLKGIVEQQFRTLNITLQPWMPGAVRKEYTKRGGPDYVLDAKLTIKDFTAMFIERILYRNNAHYMEYYPLDKALLRDKVKPIARDLWLWGLAHNHFLKKVHPEIVKLNVLPEKQVTATREGIYFEGMYFGCDELLQQGWFVKGKSIKTTIAYDRRCMNHVYVKTDGGRGFIKCNLLEKSSRFRDLSLEEVKELRYQEKLDRDVYRSTELQERVALEAKLEAIVKEAEQRSAERRDHSLTKTDRKSGIQKNRATERDKIRKVQSYDLGKSEIDGQAQEENVTSIDDYRPRSKLSLLASVKAKEGRVNG
jgi:putative transposase